MNIRIRVVCVVAALAMIAVSPAAFGATVTWNAGGGTEYWSNPLNWSGNSVPTSSDAVVINNTGTGTVRVDVNPIVQSVTVQNSATLRIQSGQVLTVSASSTVDFNGILFLDGSNFSGNGALTVNGVVVVFGGTIGGSGALTINGGLQVTSDNSSVISRTTTNAGIISLQDTGSFGSNFIFSGATLTNTGTIDIQTDHDIDPGLSSPILNNNSGGLIVKSSGSGTAEINLTVNNAAGATIETQTGDVQLNGGGTVSGDYAIGSLTSVRLGVGTFTVSGNPTVSGGGKLSIDGATLDIGAGVDVTWSEVRLTAGTITGAGALRVSGDFVWYGGTVAGSGLRVLNPGSITNLICLPGNCLLDGAAVRLQGFAQFANSNNALVFSNGSSLTIDPGKTLTIFTSSSDFINGGGAASSIINNGRIWKKTSAGTSTIGVPVTLSATSTVDIDAGTLQFGGGVNVAAGATINIAASQTLEVTGGVFQFNDTGSMPTGNFKVSAGTLRVPTGITRTISNVTLEGSGIIDGAGDLHVSGTFSWLGGTILGSGARVLDSSSTSTISCSSGQCNIDGATLQMNASGTFNATNPNSLVFYNAASLVIASGKTLDFPTDGTIVGLGTITNNGTITKSGGTGIRSIGTVLDNNGSVIVTAGGLSLLGNGTHGGSFTVTAPGSLLFDGGAHTIAGGISGTGIVAINGATVALNATGNVGGFSMSGGTLGGSGTLTLANGGTWSGGTMSGSGTTAAAAGKTLTVFGLSTLNGRALDLGAGAMLDLTGQMLDVPSAASVTGGGTVRVNGGTLRVLSGVTQTIPNLTLTAGVIDGAGTLQVSGTFIWHGGTIAGSGPRVLTSTSTPTILCDAGIDCVLDGAALQLQASMTYSPSTNAVVFTNGASMTIDAGKTLSFSNSGDFLSGFGGGSISNNGTISKITHAGMSNIGVPLNNNSGATVNVNAGTLRFGGGVDVAATATIAIAAGQTLEVTGGVFVFNGTGSIPSGSFKISAGTLRVPSSSTMTISNVTLQGGVIDGGGTLILSGSSSWTGGTMGSAGAPGGITQIDSGNTLNITASTAKSLTQTRQLLNNGTVSYGVTGAGAVTMSGSSKITNNGTLNLTNDNFINNSPAGSALIENNGTFAKTSGTGDFLLFPRVENNNGATMSAVTGRIRLSGGGIAAGSYAISSGAALYLSAGTFTVASTSTVAGAGNLEIGGTVDISSGANVVWPNVSLTGGGIVGPGALHVSGMFTWLAGTISGAGTRVLDSTSTPTLSCGICVLDGAALQLQASTTYSGGFLQFTNGASLTIDPGKTLNVTNDGDFGGVTGSSIINNGTIWKKTTAGTSFISVPVTLSGTSTVIIDAGTLQFAAGTSVGGNAILNIAAGKTLEVTGGVFQFNSGTGSMPGSGTFKVSGATLRVPTGITKSIPNLTLQGSGVIDGGGTLILSGTSTWASGSMGSATAPGGITQIDSGSTLNITSAGSQTLAQGRELRNSDTLNYSGNSTLTMSGGSKITNDGFFSLTADGNINDSGATIDNNGLLQKSGGSGTSTLFPEVNGNGVLSATTGTLALAGGGTLHNIVPTAPATIAFTGGTHSILGVISGSGTIAFSGGAFVTVNNSFTIGALSVTAGVAVLNANGSADAFTMTGGTLGGSGTLTLTNGGTWSGGAMSGSGTTINPATKSLGISAPVTLNSTLQNNGTLSVSANVAGSGTISNNGTLDAVGNITISPTVNNSGQVATSGALSLAGGGTNSGSVSVTSPGNLSFLSGAISINGGSIGGTGTLSFSGATATIGVPVNVGTLNVSGGTATLNASASANAFTMTGGTLDGSGTLTLTNGGTWSGGTMSGSGTTISPATKTLDISAPVTINGRTLQNDGTLSVNGNVTGSGTIANNGTLTAIGIRTISAPLNNSGQLTTNAVLSLAGGGTHSGTFTASGAGSVIDFSGGVHTISGPFAGTGQFGFSGGTATVNGAWSGAAIVVSGGSVALNTSGTLPALNLSGGTLAGSGALTVTGASTWSGGTIGGSGPLTFDSGATVTMPGTSATTLARPLLNSGTINFTAASSAMLIDNVPVTNNGTFDIQSAQGIMVTPGTPPFINSGTLKKSSGAGAVQFAAPLSNSGLVQVGAGTLNFSGVYAQTAGTTEVQAGATLQTGLLSLNGGSLNGNGTIAGTVDNHAVVAPGASPGTLTISGDYVQASNGALDIQLGGTTPGTQYDRLAVSGTVTLDGTLNVTTVSGFVPAVGNAFQFLTYGARANVTTFATTNGLDNDPATVLVPIYGLNDVQLITSNVQADIFASVSAPPAVANGSAFAYTVNVLNQGGSNATGVNFTASLPPNVTFNSASPAICIGAPSLICTVGALPNQSSATVILNVTADGSGAAPLSIFAGGNEFDPNTANNTASVSPSITAEADLRITVAGTASTLAGSQAIYSIVVTNNGPNVAGVAVSVAASPALTFSANSGVCAGSFPCTISALSPGQSATINSAWDISSTATGSVQLTVSAASSIVDPDSSNNSASATTLIGTCPAIIINAPSELRSGASAEANATLFDGAVYIWSISNGTIDKGDGTASVTFTAGSEGTATLSVNVTGGGCTLGADLPMKVKPRRSCEGTATPSAPVDGTTAADAVVTFSWNEVDGASGYRLWLQQGDAPPRNIGRTLGTSLTKIIPPGVHRWYVETLFDGCPSHQSEHLALIVLAGQDCDSHGAPQLSAPANDTPVTSATVAFRWDAVAKAIEYELWLATAGGVPTLMQATSDTSYTASVPPGRLEWYVRAVFGGCDATESAHRSFTYTPPPDCTNQRPLLIEPAEGERLTSPVSFEWRAVPGALSYELYVDDVLAATTTSPHASGISVPRGERRWQVRARLAEHCGALDSAESRFIVIAPPPSCSPLEPPLLTAPGQISSGVTGRIQWTFVPGATAYFVQISTDAQFSRASTSVTTVTTRQLPFTFINESSVPAFRYVRVYAVDTKCVPTGQGPFSEVAVVTVLPHSGSDGVAMLTDPTDVPYTLKIGAELAGLNFTATPTVPWIAVTPESGIVPAGGLTLQAFAHTAGLPPGTSTGTVAITTSAASGRRITLEDTQSTTITLNNNSGTTTQAKDTPPPDTLTIPAVANVNGIIVRYQSDICITNTSAKSIKYQIVFTPTGKTGIADAQTSEVEIASGATFPLHDIVSAWFGKKTTSGTIEIRPPTETATSTSSAPASGLADRLTFASSRTSAVSPDGGTYGQYIPTVAYADFISTGSVISLQQIAQSDKLKRRTNLGLVESSNEEATVEVRVFDSSGADRGHFSQTLTGGQHTQINDVLTTHGLALNALDDGRIEVKVTGGAGKVTAYASVIGTDISDPLYVPPVNIGDAGHSKWVVPGVEGRTVGSGNWQTDVRIFNAGDDPVELTLMFYGGAEKSVTITLKAREVRSLNRVLPTIFQIPQDAGALHISSAAAARLVVTAHTYNDTGKGSYGQFIPASTPEEAAAAGSRPLQILQVEESDNYHSNVGFAEVSGKAVTLEVSIFRPNHNDPDVFDVELAPNQFRQYDSLLVTRGLAPAFDARISVKVKSGEGRAMAYLSLIDRTTGDPTYISGQ
jgi:fibronectin-binding autotransporter adhesin